MTTIGVDAFKPERVDALWFNSYNYHYPVFKQKQLCDYYDCYKARPPPVFRRSCVERLRQECQCYKGTISSNQGRAQYKTRKAPVVPVKPPVDLTVRPRISSKEYARWRFETTPVVTTRARTEWNNFLNRCPERFNIQLPLMVPGDGNLPYYDGGYCLRYLRPDITKGLGMERWSEKMVGEIQGPATNSPFRNIIVTTPSASYG